MKIQSAPAPLLTPPRPQPAPPKPAPQEPQDQLSHGHEPPGRSLRIGNWIQSARLSAAENLKSVSSIAAGYLIGSAVGAVVSTPISLALGNVYLMTGGTAVAGSVGAMLGYQWDKHHPKAKVDGVTSLAITTAGSAARLMDKIAYPTILNATAAERATVYKALDSIPMSGVTSTSTIDLVHGLEKQGIAGVTHPIFSQNRILLDKEQMALQAPWGEEVTIHETGHAYDFTRGVGPFLNRSFFHGFGKAPFISEYAKTNRMEDFAESYLNYHRHPEGLQAVAPGKFEALQHMQKPGVTDMIRERPSVREAGKKIGEALGSVPYLRTAVDLGMSLIAPYQLHHGAAQYEEGVENNNPLLRFQGKLNMAKGALMMGGLMPIAVGAGLVQGALEHQIGRGNLTPDEADHIAGKVLATATGPAGMVASATGSELRAAGINLDPPRGPLGNPKGQALAGMWAGVGGAAAGGVLGSLVGTAMGGALGGFAGLLWGQVGGAVVGFASHAALAQKPHSFAPNPMDLRANDKLFLGEIVGGAVVGGAAGTVAGGELGQIAGEALGSALAGPAGGAVGSLVGRTAGMLGGSYALARAGAAAGHKLADLTARDN